MARKKGKEGSLPEIIPDFNIERLGTPRYDSPIKGHLDKTLRTTSFIDDNERIVFDPRLENINTCLSQGIEPLSMEVAGPREKIYFNPENVRAAIVTCGGLCPGVNDVVRALYLELHYRYRIKEVLGIRYGFAGLVPRIGLPPVIISHQMIENIHREGGTFLGSSRGPQDSKEIVDFLERERVTILFTIGGDGTQRGALQIADEIARRNLDISIIGIPKTIDNDIPYVERSFGFQTAVGKAMEVLRAGHEEARGAYNGVTVVKLMGRFSGFIAAMAAVANGDANYVLIPEVQFDMDGKNGFLTSLGKRLEERKHALVVVAEGAGQEHLVGKKSSAKFDASGNIKLGDIGVYLRDRIISHFKSGWNAANVKYIDPSYIIRSSPANADDSIFCNHLARHAVHAAMSGRTKMVVSLWKNTFTYVPINAVISTRKRLDPTGSEWLAVLESTGQPSRMKND